MKYLKKLFLSLKEIFIMMIIQYVLLIATIVIFGIDKSIIIGMLILLFVYIIYIVFKCKKNIIYVTEVSYFPYLLLGISVAVTYNMLIFKLGINGEVNTSVPIILNIISSGIVGPIFAEFLFRYDLIKRLKKFNSSNFIIILLAGFIFAIFHNNIITIIYALLVGIINSYLYLKKNNIIVPIIIHMSGNIIATILIEYNFLILFFGIILLLISIILIKKDNCSK